MWMIFFVLDDPDQLEELLEAWTQAGIRGATIIESTGYYRKQRAAIPMRYMHNGTHDEVEGNCILYAIVPDEATVAACLHATQALVGDLDQPNTGVFASWQLDLVKGVPTRLDKQEL